MSTIKRIALLGGPSTGKSTLAARLFSELKDRGIQTELVQEYAREHINRLGKVNNILTQYLFYEKQRQKEDIIPETIEYIITDSPTILCYIYAVYYAIIGDVDHQELLVDMYSKTIRDGLNRYHKIYFLESNRPYVKDGTRTQTKEESKEIGENIRKFLDLHKIPYKSIQSPETDLRVELIIKDILKDDNNTGN